MSKPTCEHLTETDKDQALYDAAEAGHQECVKALIASGADVNTNPEKWTTPLTVACQGGHEKCVELLIEAGANVNFWYKDESDSSPLIEAIDGDHVNCLKLLVNAGAKYKNIHFGHLKLDITPLLHAVRHGSVKCAQFLIEAGVDINEAAKPFLTNCFMKMPVAFPMPFVADFREREWLCTPLILAVAGWAESEKKVECVKLLIDAGANLDAVDVTGMTALMWAAQEGETQCSELLVEAGADKDITDNKGKTAFDYGLSVEMLKAGKMEKEENDEQGKEKGAQGGTKRKGTEEEGKSKGEGSKKQKKSEAKTKGTKSGKGGKQKKCAKRGKQ